MDKKRKYMNFITVKGVLAEKNLELKTNKNGSNYIIGDIVVQTDNNSLHKFKVMSSQCKTDGTENPMYQGWLTVLNTHKSIASVGEEADIIEVKGQLDIEDYKSKNGKLINQVVKKASAVERVKNLTNYTPLAEGGIDMIFDRCIPEIDKEGNETGRYIIKSHIQKYNGELFPVDFKLIDPKGIYKFLNDVEKGEMYETYYRLINTTIERKVITEMDFGENRERIYTDTVNEMLIYASRRADEHLQLSRDNYLKALAERELKLREVEKSENKLNVTNSISRPATNDGFDFPDF